MARWLLRRDPPSWLLRLRLSVDETVEAGAGTAGVVAVSLPALAGRGVEAGEGTWWVSRGRTRGTPLVMRTRSPWGCVTVILVGGLVSVRSGSTSVAGRFLLLVRAAGGGEGGDACLAGVSLGWWCWQTGLSSSVRASKGPEREVRRVATVTAGAELGWG
jgi:hypothetical protein